MSDFVAVMDRGALAQVGPPEEVYRRPATRFVASFLGAMNWIGGVGLRPEALRLSRHPAHGSRRAIVTGKTFLGPLVYVEARLETGEACSAQASHSAACFQAGETVHVWWDAADEVKL